MHYKKKYTSLFFILIKFKKLSLAWGNKKKHTKEYYMNNRIANLWQFLCPEKKQIIFKKIKNYYLCHLKNKFDSWSRKIIFRKFPQAQFKYPIQSIQLLNKFNFSLNNVFLKMYFRGWVKTKFAQYVLLDPKLNCTIESVTNKNKKLYKQFLLQKI